MNQEFPCASGERRPGIAKGPGAYSLRGCAQSWPEEQGSKAEGAGGTSEHRVPALPPQSAAVGGCTRKALFTGGHGPSGRVHYCQAGAAGRQSFVALKDPVVSFCGRPPLTPEGGAKVLPLWTRPH